MKNERIGLILIGSTLAVIALIMALLVYKQRQEKLEQIRVQGVSLTRALSLLPLEQLAPKNPAESILRSFVAFVRPPNFAYAVVVSGDGRLLAEEAAQGTNPSPQRLPDNLSSLFGERTVVLPGNDKTVHEFFGPVIRGDHVPAYVRIGYFDPGYGVAGQELSFLAMLALLNFLLVPAVYLVFKRELRPLSEITSCIGR